MKIVNYIERHNFCCNDLLTKFNHTEIQTFEVEERTFVTPCTITIATEHSNRSNPDFNPDFNPAFEAGAHKQGVAKIFLSSLQRKSRRVRR